MTNRLINQSTIQLSLILALFLAACVPLNRTTITNPLEATRQSIRRDYPDAFGVRVLGMRNKSESEIAVIYTYNLPPEGEGLAMHFTGVSLYRRIPTGGWQLSGGGGGGSPDPPAPDQLLDYFSVHGEGTAIYGQTLSSEVAAVEAHLSNGETVRDEAGDRAFAVFSPEGVKVCKLRALGVAGEVLKENDFTSQEAGDPCIQPAVTAMATGEPSPTPVIPTNTPDPSSTQPLNPSPTFIPTTFDATRLAPDPSALSPSGPWLVYSSIDSSWLHTLLASSQNTDHFIFLSNADGSGRTPAAVDVYDPSELPDISSDTNRLAILDGLVYLVRPDQAQAYLISGHPQQFLGLDFGGSAEAGYLASVHGELPHTIPELIVHTLPSGEIRDRIPLVRCTDDQPDCEAEINYQFAMNSVWSSRLVGGLQQIAWSPDGHILAYAAVQEGPTSDLYLYNPQDGSTRQMTGGPNYIGKIWWSPNGRWIVFESHSRTEEILWATAVDGGQVRRLYSAPPFGSGQGLSGWLGDDRFLSHDGYFAVEDGYSHLRLVNLDSGEVKTLFPDNFSFVTFDPGTGAMILLLPVSNYENDPPWPGYEGHGWYMLSVEDTTLNRLEKQQVDIHWDRDLEMFVTSERCDGDANSVLGLTSGGLWQCVPLPEETSASPDHRWQVVIGDGIWLRTAAGELAGRVSAEDRGQVIWRPDSQGFFLVVNRTLEYVSVPDLTVRVVDDQLRNFPILHQWLNGGD